MKKVFITLSTLALMLSSQAKAQFNCASAEVANKLKKEHPEIKVWEEKLAIAIDQALENKKNELLKYGKTTATVYDLPIVVHVVHDYGFDYVSDNDIFNAAEYWDKTFNKENADTIDVIPNFKPYIGNPQIRLRLASIDPNGNPTKGIVRHHSYTTSIASDGAKISPWPNNKYLNIWLVSKFNDDHSGAAAYAYYPATAAYRPYADGVISIYTYINIDKTIPHEIGHTLNLSHTWGDSNSPGISCGDDNVPDTPPTYGHTSCTTTDLYDVRCATGYTDDIGKWHANSPLAPDTSNTQNIMDYSYCGKMFTHGQADRMRASLTSSVAGRNNLYSASNLVATGALLPRKDLAPIADFSVERGVMSWGGATSERAYFICQGSGTKFQFKDKSWNDTITGVKWTLSNSASTPSATTATITSTFNDVGWVDVKLEATGNNTTTTSVTKKAVYVASNTTYGLYYQQFFNEEKDFPNWPMFNYFNNNFKWEYNGTNGYPSGWGCIRYRSFDDRKNPERYTQSQTGDFDDIFTPGFNLSETTPSGNINLNFYSAGASTYASSGNRDSLQVFISTTCGDTWVRIGSLKGSQVSNNPAQGGEFAPTNASQWRAQSIQIPSTYRNSKVFFKFRYWPSEGGNNFYMDNFALSPWTTEVSEVSKDKMDIKLIPNPSNGNTQLCFTGDVTGQANVAVRDITGKLLHAQTINYTPNNFVQYNIAKELFPANGMYIVTLTQNNQTKTLKLLVE